MKNLTKLVIAALMLNPVLLQAQTADQKAADGGAPFKEGPKTISLETPLAAKAPYTAEKLNTLIVELEGKKARLVEKKETIGKEYEELYAQVGWKDEDGDGEAEFIGPLRIQAAQHYAEASIEYSNANIAPNQTQNKEEYEKQLQRYATIMRGCEHILNNPNAAIELKKTCEQDLEHNDPDSAMNRLSGQLRFLGTGAASMAVVLGLAALAGGGIGLLAGLGIIGLGGAGVYAAWPAANAAEERAFRDQREAYNKGQKGEGDAKSLVEEKYKRMDSIFQEDEKIEHELAELNLDIDRAIVRRDELLSKK